MRKFQYKTLNAFTDDELNALGAICKPSKRNGLRKMGIANHDQR